MQYLVSLHQTKGYQLGCRYRISIPFKLRIEVFHEEQQAIHHVDLAHVAVKVEREQIELGQVALELVLHTTAHDMVGYAAEGLQAHHMGSTAAHGTNDLGGEQPSFAKLGVEVDDVAGLVSDVEDVVEGMVVAEGSAEFVCTAHLSAQVAVGPLI